MNEDEIKEAIKMSSFNLNPDKDLRDDWEHFETHCDENNPIDKLVLLQRDNMKDFNPHLLRGIYLDVWKAALRSQVIFTEAEQLYILLHLRIFGKKGEKYDWNLHDAIIETLKHHGEHPEVCRKLKELARVSSRDEET